jgi:hypothetical protein
MFYVPAYGPNWRYKLGKKSKFLWHLQGIYHFNNPGRIAVAPWNRKRRPIKRVERQ